MSLKGWRIELVDNPNEEGEGKEGAVSNSVEGRAGV